jgi:HTH-type transcriptional regulator / antitoxin HigA
MAIDPVAWRPEWAVAPGEILLEVLQERRMSQSELARRMGRPIKTINEIANGKAAITPETALQLELALGIDAAFWTNLEATYRAHLARDRAQHHLTESAAWADQFPLTDLVRHKLIERGRTKGSTLASVLAFFGVSSPTAWERKWLAPAASFRASPAFASSPPAVAAWLRWGEIVAADIKTVPFDAQRLRAVLPELRLLTRQSDFMQAVARVQTLLASAGVVLVLTPEFTGTRLSGAARWLSPARALVQLSMRHKSNDQFWFSLFHELGHLLARRRGDFIDTADVVSEGTDENEKDADRFARDSLIPPDVYAGLVAARTFTAQRIRDLARQIGIAPGIIVGRLQRENLLDRTHHNDLKKRIKWAKPF